MGMKREGLCEDLEKFEELSSTKKLELIIDEPKKELAIKLELIIDELNRELAMRKSVYPRWIRNGKIAQNTADWRIEMLERAIIFYDSVKDLINPDES